MEDGGHRTCRTDEDGGSARKRGALVREVRLPAHAAQRARERASEKLRSMRRVGRDESAGEVAADAGYGVVPADDTVEGAEWLHEFGARQPVRESMPQRTTEPIV